MIRWKCKDWILHVDLEATREYYKNFSKEINFDKSLDEEQLQIWKNYEKFCANLSEVEKRFFQSLGITPQCCEVASFGINKKGTLSVWGNYKIKGTFKRIMEEVAIPAEEFVEKKMYLEKNQSHLHNGLHIGSYGITFLYPNSQFNPCPTDLEEGWIMFEFWIEAMPWLLEEPCLLKEYEPLYWWQFQKRYQEHIKSKKLHEQLRQECIDCVEQYFQKQGIRFVRIEDKKIEPLQMYWLKSFIPEGKEEEAKKVCITSFKGRQNFLWHLFSFEIAKAEERSEQETLSLSNSINGMNQKAWFFFQFDNIGWKINCASKINPAELRASIKDWYADFYITASDFSWTYAHTHEEQCGPYFYKRNKK